MTSRLVSLTRYYLLLAAGGMGVFTVGALLYEVTRRTNLSAVRDSAMVIMVATSAVASFVILFLIGRRNERLLRRDWELLLTPRGEKIYSSIESRVRTQLAGADETFDQAVSVHEVGSIDEAIHLLDEGYRVIELFAPNMLRLLAATAAFSRMVAAMAPVSPLKPRRFGTPEIVGLAYVHGVLHQFLVSSGERYRLRVYILGRSFGLAARFLLRSIQRIGQRDQDAEREWRQIQTIRQDLQVLTDESLGSLRTLLTSLAEERREELLKSLRSSAGVG